MYKQARDPKFWEKVRESPDYAPFRECIQRTYEKCGKRTEIKYSEYVSYWRTGVRTGSDGAYFEREKYFNSLLFLTLIYPDKEEYLAEFQGVIWSTCNDFSWERAAHMHQPDNLEYKEIALSGATLAAKMAEACCWLEDRLDCLIKRRIIYEIKHKYLIPFKKICMNGNLLKITGLVPVPGLSALL